jgi:AraC family transcriptional regulator, ethanolamine operon transcriptional activator
MPYESIQLTRAVSDDVDDQAAMLKGWDQSYTQLEAGGFEATVQAAFLTHGSGIFRKTTNRKLHKIFAPPAQRVA